MISKIRVGDTVDVFFENVACEFGVVIMYVPVATGDSWCICREDGVPINILNFCIFVI